MPILSQGDIFQSIRAQNPDFAVIFGRSSGFNLMSGTYLAFREGNETLPPDPFGEKGGEPFRMRVNGTHLWFVYEGIERAMSDEALTYALDEALDYASTVRAATIITNGVSPITASMAAKEARANFLISYAAAKEAAGNVRIELISLNSTFKK